MGERDPPGTTVRGVVGILRAIPSRALVLNVMLHPVAGRERPVAGGSGLAVAAPSDEV
jgi:hypothetical protein